MCFIQEVYGIQNCGFQVSYPNRRITQYAMQLTDEGTKAVMVGFGICQHCQMLS